MAHSEQRSLFGEILDWMLAPLLLLWPMSVAITWLVAQNIANHPYDRELAQMARTLARHVTLEAGSPKPKLDASNGGGKSDSGSKGDKGNGSAPASESSGKADSKPAASTPPASKSDK